LSVKKTRVYSLIIVPEAFQCVVTLEEIGGSRLIPIWIGPSEGMAISAVLNRENFPRPLTHDLITNILKEMKADISRVIITDIKNSTFFAEIIIKYARKKHTIDARTSDAIAIALRVGCDIFMDDKVFEKCPVIEKPISKEEVEAFKKRIETLKPEDFFKDKEQKDG